MVLYKWKIKINADKSFHVTFSLIKVGNSPEVFSQYVQISTSDQIKYLRAEYKTNTLFGAPKVKY